MTAQSVTAITYPVNDQLQWSGYSWQLNSPQVNNTWVDDQGHLHLKLQKIGNTWYGSILESDFTVKYGKFTWVASSPSLNLERNTTIGLFTYYDDTHEIDIEINQWPGYDQHLWFTNQPGDVDNNPQNINYSIFSNDPHLNDKNIKYTIDWKPTYILFSAVASDGTVLSKWNYTNARAIPQVNSSICMDISCLGDVGCPASGNPSEIVLESFSYMPYEQDSGSQGSDSPAPITQTAPTAKFSASPTTGRAPLNVRFEDQSTGIPTNRLWDFGDGYTSTQQNITHTYTRPETYTAKLTVSNSNGSSSNTGSITVLQTPELVLPVADFGTSVIQGPAPLEVQFTDLSQNAVSWSWDFDNNGQPDSTDQSPVYVYEVPGNYTVNLTVSNENGTVSKTLEIEVLNERSSGGSSHSSGGGGGGSPEPARNVETKELSQVYITNGKAVKFDFVKSATCVVYVSFDAKKTAGKTTTIAEELKNKSALVSELPSDEVYKSFNVWVGNGGYATQNNIENPVLCFKVEKSWLQNKSIDQATITLNRYEDKAWIQLPVTLAEEDDTYLYFTAEVPEFSSFAITGKAKSLSEEDTIEAELGQEACSVGGEDVKSVGEEFEQNSSQGEDTTAAGFEIIYGIACILAVFLYKRK